MHPADSVTPVRRPKYGHRKGAAQGSSQCKHRLQIAPSSFGSVKLSSHVVRASNGGFTRWFLHCRRPHCRRLTRQPRWWHEQSAFTKLHHKSQDRQQTGRKSLAPSCHVLLLRLRCGTAPSYSQHLTFLCRVYHPMALWPDPAFGALLRHSVVRMVC